MPTKHNNQVTHSLINHTFSDIRVQQWPRVIFAHESFVDKTIIRPAKCILLIDLVNVTCSDNNIILISY